MVSPLVFAFSHSFVSEFPELRCFAFACPAVLDRKLATDPIIKKTIKTFVYSDDWVPRLSFNSVRLAKAQIISLLQSYRQFHEVHSDLPPPNKWKTIIALCNIVESEAKLADHSIDRLPALFRQFVQDAQVKREFEESVDHVELSNKRLFVPGEIFQIDPLSHAERCCGCCLAGCVHRANFSFGTKVRPSSCDEYLEVNISPGIIVEHFPQEYYAAMQNVLLFGDRS
jgi:hypothetical protein